MSTGHGLQGRRFSDLLRYYRELQNVTVVELSDQTGIPISKIVAFEHGSAAANWSEIHEMAKILHVSARRLVYDK